AEFRARFHARQLRVVAAPLHQAGHDLHAQPARPELLRRGDHDAPVAGAQVDHVILRTHAREPQHRKGHIVGRGDERHVRDGAPDSFAIVPDARGGIARVLAGVRDGDDPWSLAGLPLKLPRARYALGKGPVAIAPEKAAFAWDLGGYQFTRYRKAKRKPSDLQLEASARVRE